MPAGGDGCPTPLFVSVTFRHGGSGSGRCDGGTAEKRRNGYSTWWMNNQLELRLKCRMQNVADKQDDNKARVDDRVDTR